MATIVCPAIGAKHWWKEDARRQGSGPRTLEDYEALRRNLPSYRAQPSQADYEAYRRNLSAYKPTAGDGQSAGESKSKSWWDRTRDWFNHNKTGQRIRNASIGFLSGFVAGCVTGAIGGAVVGSLAGGVGAGPGALGGAIIGGVTRGISGLVTGILSQPATPPKEIAIRSAIWGGITGLLAGGGSAAVGIQGFVHGGQAWHIGLETASHLNIVHIGMHTEHGLHIAFGAIKPYMANLHVYFEKAFPFFRIWKP